MEPVNFSKSRRRILQSTLAAGIGVAVPAAFAESLSRSVILTRPIPSTSEQVPILGMGTWITFNVGDSESLRIARCEVLETFFRLGGRMVDSSPMYGSAEAVVGDCTGRHGYPANYLPTTKVWSKNLKTGRAQIAESFSLWGVDQIDVFQIHNLSGWKTHLPYLRELKAEGKIRYIGVTTSHGRRHSELANIMRDEPLDFVQLTYNLEDREAEDRLLPLAMDRGIGVIVNRPFRRGALLDRLAGQPLPAWAEDLKCQSMPQLLLKFIVSHPAVTCAIPATSQVSHMAENMAVMTGPLPDASMRGTMERWFDRL